MSQLQPILLDKDLVALNEVEDSSQILQRDWESIIKIYNQNNRRFPISSKDCLDILMLIGKGLKPSTVFKSKGFSYQNFMTRYKKNISIMEDLSTRDSLSDAEYYTINSLRNDPYFILGQDLERLRAKKFNELQLELYEIAKDKAETFMPYLKEFHSDEFDAKEDKKEAQIVIKFGEGILEAI